VTWTGSGRPGGSPLPNVPAVLIATCRESGAASLLIIIRAGASITRSLRRRPFPAAGGPYT